MILVLKDMGILTNGKGSADLSTLAHELSSIFKTEVSVKLSPPTQGSKVIVYVATYGGGHSRFSIRDFRQYPSLKEKQVEIVGDTGGLETQIRETYLSIQQ